MDSKNFVSAMAKRMGTDAATVNRLAQALAETLAQRCGSEGEVAIPAFGTFTGVKHSESIVTDPATGQRTLLPPAVLLQFTPSEELLSAISQPTDV